MGHAYVTNANGEWYNVESYKPKAKSAPWGPILVGNDAAMMLRIADEIAHGKHVYRVAQQGAAAQYAPPAQDGWQCPCGMPNAQGNAFCLGCWQDRPGQQPSTPPQAPAQALEQKEDSEQKTQPAPAAASSPAKPQAPKYDPLAPWLCEACTYVNMTGGKWCKACEGPNPSAA